MSYDAPPPPPGNYGGGGYGDGNYGQAPYGGPPPAQGNSPKAVWALVCGIVGLLCFGIILGPVAIFLGRAAQREGRPGGIAKAGEILGYVDVALFVLGIIFVLSR